MIPSSLSGACCFSKSDNMAVDGFVPVAKITKEGNYSIISDYLGTPVEAYDAEGNQGQYADEETGLYNPWDFQFTQESISGVFQHGPFKGQSLNSVISLTKELGRLPDELKLDFIKINTGQGEAWATLNNRTLYVAQEAGLTNIKATDMDM